MRSAAPPDAGGKQTREAGDMEYRSMNGVCYVRVDKGEEIIQSLMEVCRRESIQAAVYTGIGGCSHAEIQTFIPEEGRFETESVDGMLELVSLTGNIVVDHGEPVHHTHAAFSYKDGAEHKMAAGHLKATTVLYTAEIELRPVIGGRIIRKHDPETGTGFWCFD